LSEVHLFPIKCTVNVHKISPVTISLFPTSIDLDPIFEKDRDLDRFRFSYRARRSVVVLNTSSDLMSLSGASQSASDDGMSGEAG